MNWKSVKKDPPPQSGEYLFCEIGDTESSVAYYEKEQNLIQWEAWIQKPSNDHCWMELPEPPEGMV